MKSEMRTRFEGLHCDCCAVIPQALEDFPKLTSSQFFPQLDWFAVNLPLVHCVVGQTVSLWSLHLDTQEETLFVSKAIRSQLMEHQIYWSDTMTLYSINEWNWPKTLPFCMVQPDARRGHLSVESNVALTPAVFQNPCSSTQSSYHFPVFSACNASPSRCPALKDNIQCDFWLADVIIQ